MRFMVKFASSPSKAPDKATHRMASMQFDSHEVAFSANVPNVRHVGALFFQIIYLDVPLPFAALLYESPQVPLRDVVVVAD